MVTVGSLAYSITANSQGFTSGIVASKAELRTLKDVFMATVTPTQQFSTAIAHLEDLAQRFPSKAGVLHQTIHQMQHEMEHATPTAQFFHHAMEHLGIVVDPVSASFKVAEIGIESFHKVIEGVVETVHAVAEKIESLNKLGLKAGSLGIDPGELIGLAGAAKELTGLDFDSFTSMLTKFSTNLGQAASEAKGPTFEAFESLGLKIDELAKMPADEALKATGEALSKVSNTFERSFLAKEIGGKVGPQFVQFLAAGDEKITEISDHVKELEQTKFIDFASIHEASIAMDDFGHRVSGWKSEVAQSFAPLFVQAFQDVGGAIDEAGLAGEGLHTVIQGIAFTVAALVDEIELIARVAKPLYDANVIGVYKALTEDRQTHLERLQDQAGKTPEHKAKEQAEIVRKASEAADKAAAAERDKSIRADAALAIAQEKILIDQEKEAAKEKLAAEKERLSIVNRIVAEEGKLYQQNEQRAEQIAKAHLSEPAKLREEFEKIQELEKGGFFDLHPGARDQALEDLKSKARDLSGANASAQSIGLVRGGSVEALRLQTGGGTSEKQLEAQKKIDKNTADANTLLGEIKGVIAANQIKEAV